MPSAAKLPDARASSDLWSATMRASKSQKLPQLNRLWCESQKPPQPNRLWREIQKLPQLNHLWCAGRGLHRPDRVTASLNIVALVPCQKSWAAGVSLAMGLSVAATAMPQISLAHSARSNACLARGLGPSRTMKQSYA